MAGEIKTIRFGYFDFFVYPEKERVPVQLDSKYAKFWFSKYEKHMRIKDYLIDFLRQEKEFVKGKIEDDETFDFAEVKRLFYDCQKSYDREEKEYRVSCRERIWIDENGKGWKVTVPRTLTTKLAELLQAKFGIEPLYYVRTVKSMTFKKPRDIAQLRYAGDLSTYLVVPLYYEGIIDIESTEVNAREKQVFALDKEELSEYINNKFGQWLRYYQLQAITEAIPYLMIDTGVTIRAVTGAGKTEIAIGIIKLFDNWFKKDFIEVVNESGKPDRIRRDIMRNLKARNIVLVVTLQRELTRQFTERAKRHGIEAEFVDPEEGDVVKQLSEIEKRAWDTDAVVVVGFTAQTLYKLLTEKSYEKLALNEFFRRVLMMVFDEAHHVPAETISKIIEEIERQYGKKFKVGLTATPWREDGRTMTILEKIGDLLPININIDELSENDYIIKPIVKQVHVLYPQSYKNYILAASSDEEIGGAKRYAIERRIATLSEAKKRVVLKVVNELLGSSRKPILVLTPLVESATTLANYLSHHLGDDVTVDFLVGPDNPEKRERVLHQIKKGEIDVLVATTIADEGLDIPNLRSVILVYPGKSSTKTLQRIGRVMRRLEGKKDAIVVDFVDELVYAPRHAEKRRKMYENENIKVITQYIRVPDDIPLRLNDEEEKEKEEETRQAIKSILAKL